MKRALITGITGQDGSYLAESLLDKGYRVYGITRRLGPPSFGRIAHFADRVTLLEADLTDELSLATAVQTTQPDEVYNLAAESLVASSWDQPMLTGEVTGLGAARVFQAVRQFCREAKVYQASSSEMFGAADESPQNENTRFHPSSPYACAKVYAHHMAVNYRESYGMFICSGISYNHESPRRGIEFVTRKITDGVARVRYGLSNKLMLGNLEAKRDWGYAGDYVEAMWLALQQDEPDDYLIATGRSHSVRDFVELAFREVGLRWEDYVIVDPGLYRPVDVAHLCGDATRAKKVLGWQPKVTFEELVRLMVRADLERLKASAPIAKSSEKGGRVDQDTG